MNLVRTLATYSCVALLSLLAPHTLYAAEEIRIGYTPFLTGPRAGYGAKEFKAVQLAVKQINEAGGVNGKKVSLIVADNQSTVPGAVAALKKVAEHENVLAIVGFLLSTQVIATSDAIKQYGIPTMIGGSNVTLTHNGNPWLFRVQPDDSIPRDGQVHRRGSEATQDRHPPRQ